MHKGQKSLTMLKKNLQENNTLQGCQGNKESRDTRCFFSLLFLYPRPHLTSFRCFRKERLTPKKHSQDPSINASMCLLTALTPHLNQPPPPDFFSVAPFL